MESRLEKNIRRKKEKRLRKVKFILILILIGLLLNGINRVNISIAELNCLEDTNLIFYDIEKDYLEFLGRNYYIDLNFIKNFIKKTS